MRHGLLSARFDRDKGQREALFRGLVTDLLGYEKMTITLSRAKQIRRVAEKMITLGKRGDLNARRQALSYIYDEKVVDKLFDELAKRYADRAGGYTRVIKIGPRIGDGAAEAERPVERHVVLGDHRLVGLRAIDVVGVGQRVRAEGAGGEL